MSEQKTLLEALSQFMKEEGIENRIRRLRSRPTHWELALIDLPEDHRDKINKFLEEWDKKTINELTKLPENDMKEMYEIGDTRIENDKEYILVSVSYSGVENWQLKE